MRIKEIFTSSNVLLASLLTASGLNFLFSAYVARELNLEAISLISIVNSLWYIVTIPIAALSSTVNHQIAYLNGKKSQVEAVNYYVSLRRNILLITLLISIIWIAAIPFLSSFFQINDPQVLLIFTPIILFGLLTGINQSFLYGNLYFYSVAAIFLAESISKILIAVGLTNAGYSNLVYIAIPLSVAISFVVSILFIRLRVGKVRQQKSVANLPFATRYYSASFLTQLSTLSFLTLDLILVRHYLIPTTAGEYAVLSLVGKMIYFLGSLFTGFLVTYASQDIGKKRNPDKTFYRYLWITSLVLLGTSLLLGPFGHLFLPVMLGSRVVSILPYIPLYSFAIAGFTLSNLFVVYHLIRRHYAFSLAAMFASLLMTAGIMVFHQNISQIVQVMIITSVINLVLVVLLHVLQRNGHFLLRNLIDLSYAFFPLPIAENPKPMGKRILIFNWRDLRHVFAGGAEVYIHELAKRWVREGNSVTLFCGNDGKSPRNETVDGIQIFRRGGFYFVYIWALVYYVLQFRGKFDVIVDCQNGIPFFAPLFAREPVYCFMYHVHQDVFRKSLIKPAAMFAAFLENRVMPWAYREVLFITISESTRQDMKRLGIVGKGIEIVYPGVDLEKLIPGEKSPHPLVVYVGRLKQYKSIDVLIKAFGMVAKSIPDIELKIAGFGEQEGPLKRLVRDFNLQNRVSFLGKISEDEKRQLMQQAWVFVNPSMMEGWGITTIEANACGTPVIASDVPGLRDSVKNPHTGFLVPHGDSEKMAKRILQLIKDSEKRSTMSNQAVIWAQKFNWDKSAEKALLYIV